MTAGDSSCISPCKLWCHPTKFNTAVYRIHSKTMKSNGCLLLTFMLGYANCRKPSIKQQNNSRRKHGDVYMIAADYGQNKLTLQNPVELYRKMKSCIGGDCQQPRNIDQESVHFRLMRQTPHGNTYSSNATCRITIENATHLFPAQEMQRKVAVLTMGVVSLLSFIAGIPAVIRLLLATEHSMYDNLLLNTIIAMMVSSAAFALYAITAAPVIYARLGLENPDMSGNQSVYYVRHGEWCTTVLIIFYSCRHVALLSMATLNVMYSATVWRKRLKKCYKLLLCKNAIIIMIWVSVIATVIGVFLPYDNNKAINKKLYTCTKCEMGLAYLVNTARLWERGLMMFYTFITPMAHFMPPSRATKYEHRRMAVFLWVYIFLVMWNIPSILSGYFFNKYIEAVISNNRAIYNQELLELRSTQAIAWTVWQLGTLLFQLIIAYFTNSFWSAASENMPVDIAPSVSKKKKAENIKKWVISVGKCKPYKIREEKTISELGSTEITSSSVNRMFHRRTLSIPSKSANAVLLDKVVRLGHPIPTPPKCVDKSAKDKTPARTRRLSKEKTPAQTRRSLKEKTPKQNRRSTKDLDIYRSKKDKTLEHSRRSLKEKTPEQSRRPQNENKQEQSRKLQKEKMPEHSRTSPKEKKPEHSRISPKEKTPDHSRRSLKDKKPTQNRSRTQMHKAKENVTKGSIPQRR